MKGELSLDGRFFLAEIDTGTAIVTVALPRWARDEFDPRTWMDQDDASIAYISLSSRIDLCASVSAIDYGWLVSPLGNGQRRTWGHTYGSGRLIEVAPGIHCIERPEHIYANRRRWAGPAEWMHRAVCTRAFGPCPSDGMVADHKNGKTLCCERPNLHWASASLNARNIAGSALRRRYEAEMN